MTKSTGVGAGGRRAGAGRPKDSRNKRTLQQDVLPMLEAEDRELPLYALLRRPADPNLNPVYVDQLNIAILPYLHPRPRSDLVAMPFFMMSDDEIRGVRRAEMEHQRQLARSRPQLCLLRK